MEMNNIIKYVNTDDYLEDVCTIIDSSQSYAYKSVNAILVIRNWYIGKRIAEEELKGSSRAEYGTELVDSLAKILTEKYGKGFIRRAIYQYISFYRKFPQIVYSQGTQFGADENVYLLSTQTELLSWTHYRTLLQVEDDEARLWYEKEAYNQVWSVKTLQRNIYSQYYL